MASEKLKLIATAYEPRQFPASNSREIVMVGRSNVGKSTLLNRLAGLTTRDVRKTSAKVSSQPGCTRSINFYHFWENSILVDMPGYGFARMSLAQRRALGTLVDAYLADRRAIACMVHVADVRLPLQPLDWKMLEWGEQFGAFYLLVLNKCDKLSRIELEKQKKNILASFPEHAWKPQCLAVSAKTGAGFQELTRVIRQSITQPLKGDGHHVV